MLGLGLSSSFYNICITGFISLFSCVTIFIEGCSLVRRERAFSLGGAAMLGRGNLDEITHVFRTSEPWTLDLPHHSQRGSQSSVLMFKQKREINSQICKPTFLLLQYPLLKGAKPSHKSTFHEVQKLQFLISQFRSTLSTGLGRVSLFHLVTASQPWRMLLNLLGI